MRTSVSATEAALQNVADDRATAYVNARIAVAQAKLGETDGARDHIRLAKAAADMLGRSQRARHYKLTAEAQIEMGDHTGALATVQVLPGSLELSWRCTERIIDAQIKAGDFAGAKAAAQAIADNGRRSSAYRDIVRAQIKAADFTGAKATVDNAMGIKWHPGLYVEIARGASRAGRLALLERWIGREKSPELRFPLCLGAAGGLAPADQ